MIWNDTFKGAYFSPDRVYRYTLWRNWWLWDREPLKFVAFIGLNPSTADETQNDPTVTRCINYARHWGFDGMVMLNIFGYRATDPREMKKHPEPIGEENNLIIIEICIIASMVVCCWGNHGAHNNRADKVLQFLGNKNIKNVYHLGLTKQGQPKHPLYLRADLEPVKWGDYRGVIKDNGKERDLYNVQKNGDR